MGDDAAAAQVEVGLSLIKQLASCNKSSRDKALRLLLKTWLPSQPNLTDDVMKKLWKGLFYCVWHADKLPIQSHLIDRLCSLLPRLHSTSLSLHYFSSFLLTMRREWPGIDSLRLDKFYLFIRRFLHYSFAFLKIHSWEMDLTSRLITNLEESCFLVRGNLGVSYHIASVFLEELRPFLPLRPEVLQVVFKPFVSVMGSLPDKVLLGKIKSNMFDALLKMGNKLLEIKKLEDDEVNDNNDDDAVVLGTIALTMGFSSKFFELGSSVGCCQGNRKVLFALYEEFSKLEKDLESLGIQVSIPRAIEDDDDDEQVPNLIPIGTDMEVVGLEKPLKKCDKKKNKKKVSGGSGSKKGKKKKNDVSDLVSENGAADEENESLGVLANAEISNDGNSVTLNESVISNLQMQFEKVAAEAGLDNDAVEDFASACELPKIKANGTVSKKRKRAKSMNGQNPELNIEGDAEGGTTAKSGEKSSKKVRFSMKNNLVWKPHSPLPPQSLRLPPSATPRGSALKKGVPPGPIKEMAPATKRVKRRAVSVKKAKKGISPSKRLKKLKSRST